ncbi:benzoate 4-monooxygenase cytochrome P450 [Xylaria sp. FL0064]|nr:benzoate 4-monooxygenase cytochrome P450 [Xylaria sp. FL0064]
MHLLVFGLTFIKYVALLVISYYLGLFGYRLLLHPLSKYPGPFVAKLTDAYGGFYSFKRNLHLRTWRDHQQYATPGRAIRQGPNKLVFNSIQAVHDTYLNDGISKSFCYQAGNVNPTTTNVFNTIDKRIHRIKPQLKDRSALINMSERGKYLGLDIAAYLGFGYALNLQSDSTYRYLVDAMMIGSWRLNMYMQFPALRKLRLEILFYLLAVIKGKSSLQTLSKMIQSRLAKDTNAEHDLYSFMADALEAPQDDRITASEIWTEGIFFLPAAGDTTSTALSALFYYLARNPECQRKLTLAIRSTFTTKTDIEGPHLAGCQYLRACINESLRMSPPVPGTLWREQLPPDGDKPLVVDGHVIPPGTQVGVNIYALHHNPEYFPDPFTYNPDRWLAPSTKDKPSVGEGPQISDVIYHSAFIPFSLGARGCAGKALAFAEVSLAMARTLWYLDFESPEKTSKDSTRAEFRLLDVFTSSHDGPYLKFIPRVPLLSIIPIPPEYLLASP